MRAEDHPYFDAPTPIGLAHRGGAKLAANLHLENTLSAFRRAVGLGYRYLETDVHATVDGVLLAFHDSRLDRVTDTPGRIAELPWATVRAARINGAEPIPLLSELLEEFPGVRINIDRNYLDVGQGSYAKPETHCGGVRISYWRYPTIVPGSKIKKVSALQCVLKENGSYDGPITGVMTARPTTVTVGTRLAAACEILAQRKISELPVVDDDCLLVGMIDITDVLAGPGKVQSPKSKVQDPSSPALRLLTGE